MRLLRDVAFVCTDTSNRVGSCHTGSGTQQLAKRVTGQSHATSHHYSPSIISTMFPATMITRTAVKNQIM